MAIRLICSDIDGTLLSGHESKAFSHFYEEISDVRKNCRLQIGRSKGILGAETQKFCHNGTF